MTIFHKLGWFWIAFVLWFFILVVLMHGCTPKIQADERSCIMQYEIIHMTHVNLSTGETALNELARQGWEVIAVDWLKSGNVLQGFYTLERCE